MSRAVILTYHSIGDGPAPLCLPAATFARHVETIVASGATVLTVSALAAALRAGALPEQAVALTFDDGFLDTVEQAAPLLRERGLAATAFCVSGRLGRTNDWPTQPDSAPRRPLADAAQLATLARDGWEIGAHGVEHAPLDALPRAAALEEVRRSAVELEAAVGAPVRAFAFPYGRVPADAAGLLAAAGLEAACTTEIATVQAAADPLRLPRVDAHYVRRPGLLAHVLAGGDTYLAVRRTGARARRLLA